MKILTIPLSRLRSMYYEEKLNMSIDFATKKVTAEKAVKNLSNLPEVQNHYDLLLSRLRYVPDSKKQLEFDCFDKPNSIYRILAKAFIFLFIYSVCILYYVEFKIAIIILLCHWIPYFSLLFLAGRLPGAYTKRYESTQRHKKILLNQSKEYKAHQLNQKKEIENYNKIKFIISGYHLCSILYLMKVNKIIAGNKTELANQISNHFLNTEKSKEKLISAGSYARYIDDFSKLDKDSYATIAPHKIKKILNAEISANLLDFKLSCELKGNIKLFINPIILKQFLMFLNGTLYQIDDETIIDSFIEHTFTFEETKQTNQYTHVKQLITRLKDDIQNK